MGGAYFLLHSHAATPALPDPLYSGGQAPWNQPIGTNPILDPNSAAMVNAVDSRVNPTMNAYGMPLYTSTASDPTYTVQCSNGAGGCDALFDSKQPIHIPNNAQAATGSDHWLFIYDTTKNLIFEMWLANKSGNTWSYNTGNVYSPTGDGVLQPDGSVQDGNGSSYFAGVVSATDMARGYINHAMSFASQATVSNQGRYPMNTNTDGGTGSGHIVPMGARFFLDPSVNCDGLGAAKVEAMVCHAMQKYGGYMHDTGGVPMSIYFQEDNSAGGVWGAQGLNENNPFTKIPWNRMHVLKSWNSYTPAASPPNPSPSPSPSPIPAPSPSPSPVPRPNPSASPTPPPTPSSGNVPASSPASSSPSGLTTATTLPAASNAPESSGQPPSPNTAAVAAEPLCRPGQALGHGACTCSSSQQQSTAGVCAFARIANPVATLAASITGAVLVTRIFSSAMMYRSYGSSPAWAVYSRRRLFFAAALLGLSAILYSALEFTIPGGIFNR